MLELLAWLRPPTPNLFYIQGVFSLRICHAAEAGQCRPQYANLLFSGPCHANDPDLGDRHYAL